MDVPPHKHCEICKMVMSFSDTYNICAACRSNIKIKETE